MEYIFENVLEIKNGKNQKAVENPNGQYPIYGSGGVMGYADDYICEADTVIIGRKGSINNPIYVSEPFWNVDTAFGLSAKKEYLLPRYLFYFCKKFDFEKLNKTVTIPSLTKSDLLKIKIDLPSKEEQQNVVNKLTKIEKIIAFRRQELASLDNLIKARFVELFGDPMINPKGYKIQKYGELFELNAGGTPSKTVPEYWENGTISWIGSNMCQNVILYENDGKYISQDGYDHSSARLFPVDTVLIALVGATIGKTALLKFETSTNQNVLGVRHIVESGYNPMFVFYYTQFLYQKFMNIGDGGFNMASKGFVSELPMYDVDLSVQNEFAIFANQVDKSKVAVQKALDETKLLFDSLMQKYFG